MYSAGIIQISVNVSNSGYYFIVVSDHLKTPTYVSASNVMDLESFSGASTNSIRLIPVDTPSTYICGQSGSYVYEAAYPNGTLLDHAELLSLLPNLNITLLNSRQIQPTIAVVSNHILVNFTFTGYGYFTLTAQGKYVSGLDTYSIFASQQISVQSIKPISKGLEETISISSVIQKSNVTDGTILFRLSSNLSNPSTPSEIQTEQLIANTSIELLYHGNFAGLLTLYYIQPGEAGFKLNISTTGTGYQILSITKATKISGQSVQFTGTSSDFTISSQNPANPPNTIARLQAFATSLPMEILYALTGIFTAAYEIIKFFRRHDEERDADENTAGLVVEGIALYEKMTPNEKALLLQKISPKVKNKLMERLTAGALKKFTPAGTTTKKANLKEEKK